MLGFTRLLASVEDLALDFPDAAHTLSLFLGRAVVDEALPPSFLAAVLPSLRNDSLGVAVVHATGATLRRYRVGTGSRGVLSQIKSEVGVPVRQVASRDPGPPCLPCAGRGSRGSRAPTGNAPSEMIVA